jgi:hypothetical protein
VYLMPKHLSIKEPKWKWTEDFNAAGELLYGSPCRLR